MKRFLAALVLLASPAFASDAGDMFCRNGLPDMLKLMNAVEDATATFPQVYWKMDDAEKARLEDLKQLSASLMKFAQAYREAAASGCYPSK